MNLNQAFVTYRRLRDEPLWRLLAADNGPVAIALLQNNLMEGNRKLAASILYERLERDLEQLRARGEALPQTARAYVADWLAKGWLIRRFPAGATEEEYELSAAAAKAIHLIGGLVEPRSAVTGSRLATVIHQLGRLVEETDADPESRMTHLLAERERIDASIAALRKGRFKVLEEDEALERVRDIIALSGELIADFHSVRDDFEHLNRDLRERIMDDSGSRGDVLEKLFAGIDVIAESESGRTFHAFWRLLTDPEQNAALEAAIEELFGRDFSNRLEVAERRFLLRLIQNLLAQGGTVHEVLQQFARSLKQFVQSREYMEQRRINRLISEAQQHALALKNEVKAGEKMNFHLQLTSSRIRSLSQWNLMDPSENTVESGMAAGDAAQIGLDAVAAWVMQSEIDFRGLADNIRACLAQRSQVCIGEVLRAFPAAQGLGSVVGYLALGSRHGRVMGRRSETVAWTGEDMQQRSARIPLIYFLKEQVHELA
ncbi:DUF3375 domain-containing protein [Desulfatitalea alkaliphila]|uniref:DUF3375 domain-containing protein n=1 Tax=Desulfatitalea alkaliphila TaxID=2929485 RepID=A0AA41QZ81_9BACT|nr:DUF3375 domain-containing protein [Desulfatitalea alkaliphila]MCJ8499802.1 DUF3375 domain-containing protein [Desulfatitalea alkaliphila]